MFFDDHTIESEYIQIECFLTANIIQSGCIQIECSFIHWISNLFFNHYSMSVNTPRAAGYSESDNTLSMDYNTVTDEITRLTDDLNVWSSTLCIPVNDSDTLLDISSAANGADSSVPNGAMNQPMFFPTSKGLMSVYRFDPAVFFGESSWDDLRSMLKSAVSECNNISVQKTHPPNSLRAKYYILGCDHSRLYRQQGSISYLDDKVGPLNVVDEKAKRHKSYGSKHKG